MSPIRIVIADDHVFYREGVKAMLSARGAAEVIVVGEAGTGEEAIQQTAALAPDVVLMDLTMPGLGGLAATRRIAHEYPHVAILILTMSDDDSVFAALRAGARGYLLKDATVEDLIRAVTAVHRGEAIFSPSVGQRLTAFVARAPAQRDSVVFPDLTEREHDILRLLVAGRANHEIAAELNLTPKTVRNYVSAILAKLHVADRAQAVAKARAAGYPPDRS